MRARRNPGLHIPAGMGPSHECNGVLCCELTVMPAPVPDILIEPIVQFARELHSNRDPVLQYLLWEQVEGWLRCGAWEKLRFLLRKLPLTIIPDTPDFFYVRGHAFWGLHRLEEARNFFEKARYFYRVTQDDSLLSALSCIDIADIAHSRRQYQDAEHYLQVANTLMASAPSTNSYIAARYGLTRAVVLYERGPLVKPSSTPKLPMCCMKPLKTHHPSFSA